MNFNPRSPHGERHYSTHDKHQWSKRFQPTLPARGATSASAAKEDLQSISTHAPRTGSDRPFPASGGPGVGFQPTLPARGATVSIPPMCAHMLYFNPRSPHGERRHLNRVRLRLLISTHAPRTGSDRYCDHRSRVSFYFNPRSPHGERRQDTRTAPAQCYFNPRSPHGERRQVLEQVEPRCLISTHAPRTGSDRGGFLRRCLVTISTHAPRTGSDRRRSGIAMRRGKFQPTLPARGATYRDATRTDERRISTHAPRTGSDARPTMTAARSRRFQPTLPARGATPGRRTP